MARHGAVKVQGQQLVLQYNGHLVWLFGQLPADWVQDGQHFLHLLHLQARVELQIQISPHLVPVIKQFVLRVDGLVAGFSFLHGRQGTAVG